MVFDLCTLDAQCRAADAKGGHGGNKCFDNALDKGLMAPQPAFLKHLYKKDVLTLILLPYCFQKVTTKYVA